MAVILSSGTASVTVSTGTQAGVRNDGSNNIDVMDSARNVVATADSRVWVAVIA